MVLVASEDSGLKPEYTYGNTSCEEFLLCLFLLSVMEILTYTQK